MLKSIASFIFLVAVIALPAKAAEPLVVLVEDAFPLQYIENNQYQGTIAKQVKQLLQASNIDEYQLALLPWARALATAKHKSNHLIVGLVRTPEREADYQWIGVIEKLDYYFYTSKEVLARQPISAENIKSFRIGTMFNSATHRYLATNGFASLFPTSTVEQNYEKLINGRIDLIPASRTIFQLSCQKVRQDCQRFVPVMPIDMPSKELWIATGNKTPKTLVNLLRQRFTLLR